MLRVFLAALAALVLGLLVASAKANYEEHNGQLHRIAADVVAIDRALARYGEDAREARAVLRSTLTDEFARVSERSRLQALTLVNSIAASDEGLTLTELAQQVGLSSSTAHRLLTTLEQERFVQFDADRRLWSVGVQAFVTGSAFLKTRSLVGAARPHMRMLMEESEETVNLAVEDEAQAIYLSQVDCWQMMRAFARLADVFRYTAQASARR